MFVSYAQNFEDVMLRRALRDISQGQYIDVGAGGPELHSVTKSFYDDGWSGINLEPDETCYAALVADRPRDVNLSACAAAQAGSLTYFRVPSSGLSTTVAEQAEMYRAAGYEVLPQTLPARTLRDICEQYVTGPIHFLKIDVEGAERDVLLGADFTKFRPWIVVVEATRPNSRVDVSDNWESLLLEAGYSSVYFDGLNKFYLADEQAGRAEHFKLPPNVFDGFTVNHARDAWMRADEAEQRAAVTRAQLGEREGNIATLSQRLAEAEKQGAEAQSQLEAVTVQTAREADRSALLERDVRSREEQVASLEREARSREERVASLEREARSREAHTKSLEQLLSASEQSRIHEHKQSAVYRQALRDREARLVDVYRSRSWKWSAPLRTVGTLLRSRRGRAPSAAAVAPATILASNRLFIECTHTYHSDLNTGIQRVVRSILRHAPEIARRYGYEVVPVIVDGDRLVHADPAQVLRNKQLGSRSGKGDIADGFAECESGASLDRYAAQDGNVLLLLDSSWTIPLWPPTQRFKRAGGRVYGVIYDLIPLSHSKTQVDVLVTMFREWLEINLLTSRMLIGISRATANAIVDHVESEAHSDKDRGHGEIAYFHLGSELDFIAKDEPPRPQFKSMFDGSRHVFLCVGTIEPRKRQDYVLDAFERYWRDGGTGALVFIGRQAWKTEQLLERIAKHARLGKDLFLVRDASDVDLDYAYKAASALVLASEIEGFGLPIVEAGQRGLPVLCSDIPVFREVAGDYAILFSLEDPDDLARKVQEFADTHPATRSEARATRPWLNWSESTAQLLELVFDRESSPATSRVVAEAKQRVEPSATEGATAAPARPSIRNENPRLFIECTHTYHSDLNTGIQRVVRNIVRHAPEIAARHGLQVVPVILEGNRYVHADPAVVLADKSRAPPVGDFRDRAPDPLDHGFAPFAFGDGLDCYESHAGNMLLMPDASWDRPHWGAISQFKTAKGSLVSIVYDLIPITHAYTSVPELTRSFTIWLDNQLKATDAVMGISRATSDSVRTFMDETGKGKSTLPIGYFHLGSDLDLVRRDTPPRESFRKIFDVDQHVFVVVGTIEPRKNHEFIYDAFCRHWEQGGDGVLLIIGKGAWKTDELLERIRRHPLFGQKLHLIRDASDEELDFAYRNSSALIIASQIEGFGLPVVEAFQHGLPVICSDIPVFREIAEGNALFFSLSDPDRLVEAVRQFSASRKPSERTDHQPIEWLSWRQSVEQLIERTLTMTRGSMGKGIRS